MHSLPKFLNFTTKTQNVITTQYCLADHPNQT